MEKISEKIKEDRAAEHDLIEQARCEAVKLTDALSFASNVAASIPTTAASNGTPSVGSGMTSPGFRDDALASTTNPFGEVSGNYGSQMASAGAAGPGFPQAATDSRGGEGTVDGRKLRRVMDLFSFLGIGEGGQTIPVVEKIDASDGRSPVGSGGDSVDYSGGRGMFDSDFSGAASPAATDGAVATASQRAPSRSPPVAAVPRGTDGLVEQTRGDAVAVQNSGVVEQVRHVGERGVPPLPAPKFWSPQN